MGPEDVVLLAPYAAVYVEVPKVACTSLKTAFAGVLGIDLQEAGGNPHRVRFPQPAGPPRPQGPFYPGLFAFAFVRNPWDRLVSCYRDKIAGEVDGFTYFTVRPGVADCLARFDAFVPGMSFAAFVEAVARIPDADADAHFRSQYTFVTNGERELAVDFVGRYERLADDLAEVRGTTGLPDFQIPRLQAARSAVRYQDYYTPHTRELAADRFRTDIDMFGYRFGS